jgi:hypothetical protein
MNLGQLKAVLAELARQHEASGDTETSKALRKLTEAFDGPQQHTVARKLAQIRVARGLSN